MPNDLESVAKLVPEAQAGTAEAYGHPQIMGSFCGGFFLGAGGHCRSLRAPALQIGVHGGLGRQLQGRKQFSRKANGSNPGNARSAGGNR